MIFSRHRFTRTFTDPLFAPAACEAAVIEEELQQASQARLPFRWRRNVRQLRSRELRFSTSELLRGVLFMACETAA